MATLLDKVALHPKTPRPAAFMAEQIARAGKIIRVSGDRARRRALLSAIPQKPEFKGIMNPASGYGWLPKGSLSKVPAAVEFAKKVLEEKRNDEPERTKDGKVKERYLVHLLVPSRYEEAPPLFDLALSDEVLQIATEYLGEVPVLLRVQIMWSPVNSKMRGSQYYHRDGRKWLQRRVKFVIAAGDMDEDCGPFTFLPGDVSERISDQFSGFKMQDRVDDEEMYRYIKRDDELKFLGPAESGLVLDTSRCFHFGSRSRGKERLVIMFQFWSPLDLPPGRGVNLRRSPVFEQKFGNDPVRKLLIPDEDGVDTLQVETD